MRLGLLLERFGRLQQLRRFRLRGGQLVPKLGVLERGGGKHALDSLEQLGVYRAYAAKYRAELGVEPIRERDHLLEAHVVQSVLGHQDFGVPLRAVFHVVETVVQTTDHRLQVSLERSCHPPVLLRVQTPVQRFDRPEQHGQGLEVLLDKNETTGWTGE